jgi:predicted ATPase
MITQIELLDFKSFEDSILKVGPFTVIIGANASGKSNLRDAFRFIHGIGRGYTLPDIIGGRYGAGGQSEWAQMRGAASEIMRFGTNSFEIRVRLRLPMRASDLIYSIKVEKTESRSGFRVVQECLRWPWEAVFDTHPSGDDPVALQGDENHLLVRMAKTGGQRKFGARIASRPDQPALTQIVDFKTTSRQNREIVEQVIAVFDSIRFLDLIPDLMRKPAFPGQTVLGDNGENLPTVLQDICADPARKEVLASWIRELTPMDVSDFEFLADPITGLVQLALLEHNGNKVSAYSASDGTLRFLAMLAALFGSNPAGLYFFEEIDNGIHPSRLRLLLDLLESQTAKTSVQVVTTTHSPELLQMIGDKTFEFTSAVYKLPDAESSEIALLSSLPKAELLRSRHEFGALHSSGWIEDTLTFGDERARAVTK